VKVTDWIANLDFPSKYYHAIEFEHQPLQLRVHRGWGMMYMAIKQDVRALWRQYHQRYPSAETEIVGWSLGSSLAILCAQDLNYNFGVRPYLYTFGTVRPFKTVRSNVDRMQRYLSTVCTECWNFSNVNDLISYLPPFPGFRMIHRVNVETEKSLSLFRIVHPFHYHIDYDRETLYEPYENGADPDGPEGRAVRALRGRKKR
ncbi:MAG: hypothetical protein IJL69_07570, partial [Oscillospiraceae bacterium]|nr:hypothetical protein [Oscillospiraceae bacterium]